MKEIDRLKARIQDLKKANSPHMLAYIVQNRENKNIYNCSYEIRCNGQNITDGSQNCSTRELANDYCHRLQNKYNIPDDKAIIINIVSTREGLNDTD